MSIVTGATLCTRLSGRQESSLQTVQILLMALTSSNLPDRVQCSNLFALDRGYLFPSVLHWLTSCGAQIIGTTQRRRFFPFTFGADLSHQQRQGRTFIEEKGALGAYWSQRQNRMTGTRMLALAFRMGCGRVATLFTTIPDIDIGKFCYTEKRVKLPTISEDLLEFISERLIPLTSAQGGVDWHIVRASHRTITSTISSTFLQICQDQMDEAQKPLLFKLGIRHSDMYNCIGSEETLNALSVTDLKRLLKDRRLPCSGPKPTLVQRLLEVPQTRRNIAQELLDIWFRKPLKSSTALKTGLQNEDNISAALPLFVKENSGSLVDIVELSEVGLLARADRRYLSTSIDRLARLRIGGGEDEVAAVEFKTMTNTRTCSEALRRVSTFDISERCIDAPFGGQLFKQLVWTREYRAQLLHHAAVIQTSVVLFVVASTTQIIYTAVVKFADEDISLYLSIADSMNTLHIQSFESSFGDLQFKHAVDAETVRLWSKLGNAIAAKNRTTSVSPNERMLKPAHSIVPNIVALWNSLKGFAPQLHFLVYSNKSVVLGGEDVFGRMLKNVKIDFRSLSPRAFIFIRGIMTQLLNAHLAFRIVLFHQQGKIEEATSYRSLKRALNSHSTFQSFLFELRQWSPMYSPRSMPSTPPSLSARMQADLCIPKRNRLTFFNTDEGKKIRLSSAGHNCMSGCRPKRCYLCKGVTTAQCSCCQTALCRTPFALNRTSCWMKHHNSQRVRTCLDVLCSDTLLVGFSSPTSCTPTWPRWSTRKTFLSSRKIFYSSRMKTAQTVRRKDEETKRRNKINSLLSSSPNHQYINSSVSRKVEGCLIVSVSHEDREIGRIHFLRKQKPTCLYCVSYVNY